MYCVNCLRFGADDPDTGAASDDLCPTCKADGYDLDAEGRVIAPDLPAVPVETIRRVIDEDVEPPF